MEQTTQPDAATIERLRRLVGVFGTVPRGTTLEELYPHLGALKSAHDLTQRLYASAMRALFEGLEPGTPDYEVAVGQINGLVAKLGVSRGFAPLQPDNIPHLEIAFAASVVQVVLEYMIAGAEHYAQQYAQALQQIPAQFRMPGTRVDMEWFDPNTGEPQGSNNSERGAALAAKMQAEREAAAEALKDVPDEAYEAEGLPDDYPPPSVEVPQRPPADSTIMRAIADE